MTDSDPQIMILVIGVAVVLTAAIAVEYASLRRIVMGCAVDAPKKEGTNWKVAIESWWKAAKKTGTDGADETVVASALARTKCDAFKKTVYKHVANLWKERRDLFFRATGALWKFLWNLLTATSAAAFSRKVLSIGGTFLFIVLVSIQVLYYNRFDFDVFEYLSSYSVPAVLLSLAQTVILLPLLSLIVVAVLVFLLPMIGLLLIGIVYGMHLVAVRTLAGFLFAACRRWLWCSHLVLPLLAGAPAVPASKTDGTEDQQTEQVDRPTLRTGEQAAEPDSPLISFIEDYGSKLFKEKSESEFSQRPARGDTPPTPVSGGPEGDKNDSKKKGSKKNKNDSKKKSLALAGWIFVIAFFVVVSLIALYVEPRYRAHAVCDGSIITRVVLDPPLQGQASFTRIGSIGGHVFIVPESSCGRSEENGDARKSDDHQSRTANEETETNGAASVANAGIAGTDGDEGDGDGSEPTWKAVLRYVPGLIRERLPLFDPTHLAESRNRSIDVTIVPLSRVLCMYEVRENQSSEPAICGPVLPPGGDGPRILVHKTQENTWKIVIPSDVRIRIEDERLLTEEIEQDVCDGGVAEISEPVLFKRGETTPLDEGAAIPAFLNRSALPEGVKLHVLGFASGDGNHRYNQELARQRAEAVAEIVKEQAPDRELVIDSWGETHLTNGVANSRSVRIVGCRPEAGDSGI